MNKNNRGSRITWLPALPEEGWASMDRYWLEMSRCEERSREVSPFVYTRTIESWLGAPPRVSQSDTSWRRTFKKYLWYPKVCQNLEGDLFHVLDQSYAHLIPWIPSDKKVVATVFDLIPLETSDGMSPEQVRRFRNTVTHLRRANHLVSISEETKLKLHHYLGISPDKVTVALPGMDLEAFRKPVSGCNALRARLAKLPPILLSVGSTLKRKNLESLLPIFEQMKQQFREKRCCFVRAGERFSPELRQKFENLLGPEGFVELGPQFGDDLMAAYQAARVFLFPSTLEGLTFTIPEAMAAGCAVVTNRCTANPEAGGDAALYYQEGHPAQASDLICRLLSDETFYQKHVALGSRRAEAYTWLNHFRVLESVYDQVLGEKSKV